MRLIAALVALIFWGCGLTSDDLEPTATPEREFVDLRPPNVVVSQDGRSLEMDYPCPWMLATFYTGHPWDREAALIHLQNELNALIPSEFFSGAEVDFELHPREELIDKVLGCEWEKQISPETEAQLHAEREQRKREQEEEWKRTLQEWKARQ